MWSPTGRDTVTLHFTWHNRDEAVQQACRAVELALLPFGARPHWGKVFFTDPDEVRARYDRMPAFADLVGRRDPDRKFGNAFVDAFVR